MTQPPQPPAPVPGDGGARSQIKTLSELEIGLEADCFVLLAEKEKLRTKDGKPYYKTVFRDKWREIQTPIWSDAPFFDECDKDWQTGKFYKIRAVLRESGFGYGPKFELRRVRETIEADKRDGFDPNFCRPSSDVEPEALANEILAFAKSQIGKGPLLTLLQRVFKENRDRLFETAASRAHHRPYPGGLLEHALSVAKIAVALTDHFRAVRPELKKTLSKPLIVAGAILHDVGKIIEMEQHVAAPRRTVEGELLGHAILSRDVVKRYADAVALDDETRIRLEHLVLTHARFPDWGAPTPPASLEGMILHYADYADATFFSSLAILDADDGYGAFTVRRGPFGTPLLKPSSDATQPPKDGKRRP